MDTTANLDDRNPCAIIATMVALLATMAIAVGVEAAQIAWRDWQRERASWNCEPGKSHRLEDVGHGERLTHRRGMTLKPTAASDRLMIWMVKSRKAALSMS